VKNRMREICTSGTVGGEGGNILAYPAAPTWQRHVALHPPWAQCAEFIIGPAHRVRPLAGPMAGSGRTRWLIAPYGPTVSEEAACCR